MLQLIYFILMTTGLVWILNQSRLLKSFREHLTISYQLRPSHMNWFFNEIFRCSGCMGTWVSIPVYLLVFHSEYYLLPGFMCIGAISSVFIISLWQKMERS